MYVERFKVQAPSLTREQCKKTITLLVKLWQYKLDGFHWQAFSRGTKQDYAYLQVMCSTVIWSALNAKYVKAGSGYK